MAVWSISINRYYDPTAGQFTSVDPMVILTGEPYSYTGGNPVNAIDSNGMLTFPSWLPGGGVVTNFQNQISGGVKQIADGTYGICFSGGVGFGLGINGQLCLVESGLGRHIGATETVGVGGQSPAAGISVGLQESNATAPSQLAKGFGNVNGSIVIGPDIGITAGVSGIVGNGICNRAIVGGDVNVSLGVKFPIPFSFGGGGSWTWVQTAW